MNRPGEQPTELRLFISSTFRDLQEEREYLVKKVFPEIRALCRERGAIFTEIDLRWGLTEEEAAHGRIVRACLEEIDRCRPHFLGIVGSRYGWVPEYHEVAMDPELHSRYPWVEEAALEGRSILEIEFAQAMEHLPHENATIYRRLGESEADVSRLIDLVGRLDRDVPIREFRQPEELGRMVRSDLLDLIEKTWPVDDDPGTFAVESRHHEAFARSRRRAYIPIPEYRDRFTDWIDDDQSPPLVVSADSGMGKSAFLAWIVNEYRRRNPESFVIEHYVGAAGASDDHLGLIGRVVEEIRDRYGIDDEEDDRDPDPARRLADHLGRVGAMPGFESDRLLLVIDALDQLAPISRELDWLPERMPTGVRLLVSTRPGLFRERLVDGRSWAELRLRPLEAREREAIVVRYLGEFHKRLPTPIIRRIGADTPSASPLYVRTLAEELRLHGSHEELDATLDHYLAADSIDDLFRLVLERMEGDYSEHIVGSILSSIRLSRAGLSERDLIGATGVSRADLSILLYALDYHLLRSNGRLDFFHDYLARAVANRYLETDVDRDERLRTIADWFERKGEDLLDEESDGASALERDRLRELLHLLVLLDDPDRLAPLLVNPSTLLLLSDGETEGELLGGWRHLLDRSDEGMADRMIDDLRRGVADAPPSRQIDLRLALVRLFRSLGDWERSLAIAEEAVEHVEESGESGRLGEVLGLFGDLHLLGGTYERALEAFERRREIAVREKDELATARADSEIGGVLLEQGDQEGAAARFERALEIFRRRDDPSGIAGPLAKLGEIDAAAGRDDDAIGRYREALRLARSLGNRRQIAAMQGRIGLLAWNRKEYDEAMYRYGREEETYRLLGDRHGAAMAGCKVGLVKLDRDDLDGAEESFLEYLAISRDLGYRRGIGFAQGDLGIVALRRGNHVDALAHFDDALTTHQSLGFPFGVALWLKWKAETVAEADDEFRSSRRTDALDWAERAAAIAREIGNAGLAEEAEGVVGSL